MIVERGAVRSSDLVVDTGRRKFAEMVTSHILNGRRGTQVGSSQAKMTAVNDLDELVLAARDGNRLALDRFTQETLPAVQKLCWHLGDPDTADDLVQETYRRMMQSLPGFRGDGSARSWLLRIARNTCADATRSRRRQRVFDSYEALPELEAGPPAGWVEVASVLADLSPDRRQAFVLTQILDLPYQEVAEILECPIGTVRSRVARARQDLLARTQAAGY